MSQIVDDASSRDARHPRGHDETADLGARVQRERTLRGWSLTELAAESGVSRAMINRVERGASSPTATILGRLSGALGLTISELLTPATATATATAPPAEPRTPPPPATQTAATPPAPGHPQVERNATAARWSDPDTGYERRALSSPTFPVDVTEVRLPAGAEVTYPASAYAFLRHCIWVVDGTLELVHGGRPERLAPGDRIELGTPAEVTYRNPGAESCRYVVVVVRR